MNSGAFSTSERHRAADSLKRAFDLSLLTDVGCYALHACNPTLFVASCRKPRAEHYLAVGNREAGFGFLTRQNVANFGQDCGPMLQTSKIRAP